MHDKKISKRYIQIITANNCINTLTELTEHQSGVVLAALNYTFHVDIKHQERTVRSTGQDFTPGATTLSGAELEKPWQSSIISFLLSPS
jgi:hypothetical protein